MSAWRAWTNRAVSALFAPPCASCGDVLTRPLDGAVCPACWARVERFTPPLCHACGIPLPTWRMASIEAGRCPRCRRGRALISRQAAVGPHTGVLRDVVHALKYDARRSTARPLAHLMRLAGRDVLAGADVVVPVPLHPLRGWSRGFNQAALLARGLGRPVAPLLARRRATPPQVSLPAARRHRNVHDAFRARPGVMLRSSRLAAARRADLVVVLIDDVCTTGATLEACARTLREAGVGEVRALTVSRVVTGPHA